VLAVWRLPEPARGGQSRLGVGAQRILSEHEVAAHPERASAAADDDDQRGEDVAAEEIEHRHIQPRPELVLEEDPRRLSLPSAVRYVLRVPSNVKLIIASALGYFFFAGLRTFAVIYLGGHYGIGHSAATLILAVIVIAAITGALIGGRVAGRLIRRGRVDARILVAGIAFLLAALVLGPGIVVGSVAGGIVLYIVGGMALTAPNAPLDAARLDIMPSGLWGRAEGVRSTLRNLAEALAPFLFGFASKHLAQRVMVHQGHSTGGFGAQASAQGLEDTFLIMLVPLLIAGVLLLRARRDYPRDVATAHATEPETSPQEGPRPSQA
jgi:sugar phosphate permease